MASNKPWLSWPYELPTCDKSKKIVSEEYHLINNEAFIRELVAEQRERLIKSAKTSFPKLEKAAIVLAGGTSVDFELYDSDTEKSEFRQEAFFRYLFGINEPDCYAVIDLTNDQSLLFVPEVSEDSQRWNGTKRPLSYTTETYGVHETHLATDLDSVLKKRGIELLYVLEGVNLDSGSSTRTPVTGLDHYTIDKTHLHPVLVEQRVIKTEKEQKLLRIGNLISSQGHVYVMRHIRAGLVEMQLEALYKSWCHFYGGSRHQAYTCICGSGGNGSVLHYGHAGRPNDRILQDGDTVVLDMGAEYQGYATDITRSFAINGKFTEDQKIVHNAVYEAQQAVFKELKPGVSYPDMHRLAEKVIVAHLLKAGLLQNGTVEELMEAHLGAVFMPHGLGHLVGLNVHDVGGYLPGTGRGKEPGLCWLRLGRKLEAGMFITVEPGVYFNDPTLDKALANPNQAKHINQDVLKRFRGTGGCRIEDDVMITATGCENYTILPTSVEEIEEVIQLASK